MKKLRKHVSLQLEIDKHSFAALKARIIITKINKFPPEGKKQKSYTLYLVLHDVI